MITTVTSATSPAITLTDAAAQRVNDQMARNSSAAGLRFGVRKKRCSGLAYVVDLAEDIAAEDVVFESNGIKVIVDPKSLLSVAGTEIDFGDDGLSQTFLFNNPNVTGACGCGESFTVE